MAEEKHFFVVEFPDERDVQGGTAMAIISEEWVRYENDAALCLWPAYIKNNSSQRKMVMEHIIPDLNRSELCQINIKYKTATYNKAREKMRQLEEMTDVQTESSQDEMMPKRNKFKNTFFKDYNLENSSESEDEPPVPKLKSRNLGMVTTNISKLKQCSSQKLRDVDMFVNGSMSKQKSVERGENFSDELSGTSKCSETKVKDCICHKNEAMLKKMYTQIENISRDIKFLMRMANRATEMQENFVNVDENIRNLPANVSEDLETFNLLIREENIFASMCNHFQTVGGKDAIDGTRRMLSKIMSNNLAKKHNWLGRNEKIPFSKYTNVINLIIAVLRKNPLTRNTTQQEVETLIKVWLRSAGDREGGRNERRKQKEV